MNNSDLPAMPQSVSHSSYDGEVAASYDFEGGQGLTKREYAAIKAMQGVLASNLSGGDGDLIIKNAINLADGLLRELDNDR